MKLKITLSFNLQYIPKDFINRHDGCRGKNVLLQVGKMSWTVKVLDRGMFCKGWPAHLQRDAN